MGSVELLLRWRDGDAVEPKTTRISITVHSPAMSPELAMLVSSLRAVHASSSPGALAQIGLHELATHSVFNVQEASLQEAWVDFNAHFNSFKSVLDE